MKLQHRLKGLTIGWSVGGLLLFTIFALFPSTNTYVNAADGDPLNEVARVKTSTYVYSTLAISMSDKVELEAVPKSSGTFTMGTANLKVTTNNTTGYAVYLRTGDDSSSLKPANGMVEAEIGPVSGTMTESSFKNNLNTWGYAITKDGATAETEYVAVPKTSGEAVITTDTLAAEDNYNVNFAAAVGPTLPAGNYYNSVIVSVVANPIAVHTLSGITYMQEMSPYVCDYSDVDETKQLIDIRDGKSYWVAKLADGNCWMTQNLALDLDPTKTLTSADTDLPSGESYTPSSKTNSAVLNGTNLGVNYNTEWSWSWGKVVLMTPQYATACTTYSDASVSHAGAKSGDDIGKNCADYGFVNVSGNDWKDTYEAKDGSYTFSNGKTYSNLLMAADEGAKTYDAHYLIGNYYQFNAAVAGKGGNTTGVTNVEQSICPKNWRLPLASRTTNKLPAETNDFAKLWSEYGYPFSDYKVDSYGNPYISRANKEVNLSRLPFAYTYSGLVDPYNGYLLNLGFHGRFAASNTMGNNYLYSMQFVTGALFPTDGQPKNNGYSVRCVAR